MTHVTIVASPTREHPASGDHADLLWHDEVECALSAQRLAACLRDRLEQGGSVIIELHGTLGAGKTTFSRHLLRALGVSGRIKSPSYAVVEPHELPLHTVQHFDFYRFNDPQEWEDAGFRDLFSAPGLKLVEWPEQAAGLLPLPDLRLHIRVTPQEHRHAELQALSTIGRELVASVTDLSAPDPREVQP